MLSNVYTQLSLTFLVACPVSTSRYPFRVNVGFLLNANIGTNRDIHFDLPDFTFSPDFQASQIQGLVRLNRITQGVFINGEFHAQVVMECVRCLSEFTQTLTTSFQELYTLRYQPLADSGLVIPEDNNIDLAPILREYLMIEMPIKPLCKPDCLGLCVVCGQDLNAGPCEHSQRIQIE
jgi:uncharacterized protein